MDQIESFFGSCYSGSSVQVMEDRFLNKCILNNVCRCFHYLTSNI